MSRREGAILGFGHVAALAHVPAWRARHDVHIVAVADPDPARRRLAQTLLPAARVYENAAALLARERLDFVDIATPPYRHGELILQALHASCDVLCEKPLVTTLADFHRSAQAARRANLALVTVHNWKHSAQFKQVARLVGSGAVGQLTRIQLDTDRDGHAATIGPSWRRCAAQAGGGILFDHGWHALYLALALARERPLRIHAVTDRHEPGIGDVEDTVQCRIDLPSSAVELRLTWRAGRRRTHWLFVGDNGSIDLEDDRLTIQSQERAHQALFPNSLSLGSHHPDWFDGVIDDFFRAIDDPFLRYTNMIEAQWCLTLITLAYQSAATRRAVAIPSDLPALEPAAIRDWEREPSNEPR